MLFSGHYYFSPRLTTSLTSNSIVSLFLYLIKVELSWNYIVIVSGFGTSYQYIASQLQMHRSVPALWQRQSSWSTSPWQSMMLSLVSRGGRRVISGSKGCFCFLIQVWLPRSLPKHRELLQLLDPAVQMLLPHPAPTAYVASPKPSSWVSWVTSLAPSSYIRRYTACWVFFCLDI